MLASSNSSDDNELIVTKVFGGETYFIRVFGTEGSLQQSYSIEVDGPEPELDVLEPNDTFEAQRDLGTVDVDFANLTVHEAGNDDWYKWTALTNGSLTVDVLFAHQFGDLNVEVYNGAQELLGQSVSTTDDEFVDLDVEAGQKYVVRVFGHDDALQQNYRLIINGPEILPDALEANDDFNTASVLGSGDVTVTDLTIHNTSDDDWFVWKPTLGGPTTITLFFQTSLGDLDFEVYDSNRNIIATAASSFRDNEMLDLEVVGGESYTIHVSAFPGSIQPAYDLVIDGPEIQPDEFEPNDARSTATELGAGDQRLDALTVHQGSDEDWFQWSPTTSGSVTIDLIFEQSDGDVDMQLVNGGGTVIASSATSTSNESVTSTVSAGQDYFIRVFPSVDDMQRSYSLHIDGPGPPIDALERNDTFATATELDAGDHVEKGLTIHAPNNDDWFKWTSTSSGIVEFAALFEHARGNLNLQVYDANENLVGESSSSTNDESLQVTVTDGDDYFVRVFGVSGETQRRYDLVINRLGLAPDSYEPNQSFVTAADLGTGNQTVNGLNLHVAGDEDWYRWRAPQNGFLVVDALFQQNDGDLTLELYDSGNQLIRQAATSTDNERITTTVSVGQDYFVRVLGASQATHDRYELVLNPNDAPGIAFIADRTMAEDSTLSIPLVISDDDTEFSALEITASSSDPSLFPPESLTVNRGLNEATLILQPAANRSGTSEITVTVTDAAVVSTSASFSVTVTPVSDAPFVRKPLGNLALDEDASDTVIDLNTIFDDIDTGDSLSYSLRSVQNDQLVAAAVTGNNVRINYVDNAHGQASVTVRATDSAGLFVEDTLQITVRSTNDAPSHELPGPQSVNEDSTLTFSEATGNPIRVMDAEAGAASMLVITRVVNGRLRVSQDAGVTLTGNDSRALTIRGPMDSINTALNGLLYTPDPNYHGADTFTIISNDLGSSGLGGQMTRSESLTIAVRPVNDTPQIVASSPIEVAEGTLPVATIGATDLDGDTLTFSIVGGADRDEFSIDPALGALRFRSATDFDLPSDADGDNVYQVVVGVSDGNGGEASRVLQVEVTSIDNDAPTASFATVFPNARSQQLDSLQLTFTEPVNGLDLNALVLRRRTDSTVTVDLTGARLQTADNRVWTLTGLGPMTGPSGGYELTLRTDTGITDLAGNALEQPTAVSWVQGAGDANLDQQFDQRDVIAILQGGKYRTGASATWSEGDWNGNGQFDQFDIVLSNQTSPVHYLQGPFGALAKHAEELHQSVDEALAAFLGRI